MVWLLLITTSFAANTNGQFRLCRLLSIDDNNRKFSSTKTTENLIYKDGVVSVDKSTTF